MIIHHADEHTKETRHDSCILRTQILQGKERERVRQVRSEPDGQTMCHTLAEAVQPVQQK